MLEVHREELEAGDKAALIAALGYICKENIPLPYWLADGIQAVRADLTANPETSLHHAFGMERIYPYPSAP